MEHYVALFVRETSTTTGTGDLTVAADSTRRRFSDVFGTGSSALFMYTVINDDVPSEVEAGFGYMSDANTLVRVRVEVSSNSDALVNFSAGNKSVTCGVLPRWAGANLDRPRSDLLFYEGFNRGIPENPVTTIPSGWTGYNAFSYEEWGGSGTFFLPGSNLDMGLMRPITAGLSTITMRFSITAAQAVYVRVRLQIGLLSTLKAVASTYKAEKLCKVENLVNFRTYSSASGSDHGMYTDPHWLRLRRNSDTDWDFGFSCDGKSWDYYLTAQNPTTFMGGVADMMGFSVQSNNYAAGGVSVESFEVM